MKVFIYDDLHPEDVAMLQALYSRSPASVLEHIEKVKSSDRGKFMEKFYIGYGHASIGDCGTFTMFIEQVSILASKAIQNNCLYSGQEASTRYLDFSKQEIVDPYETAYSREIQDNWKKIYFDNLNKFITNMRNKYPFNPEEYKSEKIWENTIKARCFDIARSLLPLGVTTLLSWSSNLRQARDNLIRLRSHPAKEVKKVAKKIFDEVCKRYPASFNGHEFDEDYDYYKSRNEYADANAVSNHYITSEKLVKTFHITENEIADMKNGKLIARNNLMDLENLNTVESALLASRPKGAPLPQHLDAYGRYNLLFLMDFGSFRDIQRHRNGVCQIAMATDKFGFNQWYLDMFKEFLSEEEHAQLMTDIQNQLEKIRHLNEHVSGENAVDTQYYYPMGLNVMVHLSYTLPQMVYVSELRSNKTVHPSLRPFAQQMAQVLEKDIKGMAIYADMDENCWEGGKRGEQTITTKAAV